MSSLQLYRLLLFALYIVTCASESVLLMGNDLVRLQGQNCDTFPCKAADVLKVSPNGSLSLARNVAALRYRGRGTVEFTIAPPKRNFSILLNNHNLIVSDTTVTFSHPNYTLSLSQPPRTNLTRSLNPWLRIWISISAREPAFVKFGYGYLMETNTLFTFTPDPAKVPKNYLICPFINSIQYVQLEYGIELIHPPMVSNDPIILDPSPRLILPQQRKREHDMLTDGKFYLPTANLPFAARGLLEQVENFEMTEEEVKAIQYSVQTKGAFLNEIIKGKGKPGLTGYLRADLQMARRTAPGQEMVLEIWLPSGASSIHNHGDSSSVIKVLHGKISSEFYNPIMDRMRERPFVVSSANLTTGDYTWMTDSIYQTHRLINYDPVNVAITIQSYGYEDDARERADFFYYLNEACNLNDPTTSCHTDFFPIPDFKFSDIKKIILPEYLYAMGQRRYQS